MRIIREPYPFVDVRYAVLDSFGSGSHIPILSHGPISDSSMVCFARISSWIFALRSASDPTAAAFCHGSALRQR
eukprot:2675358-Rhodomonas_salina.4